MGPNAIKLGQILNQTFIFSRVGHFIEVQVSDGALYRTKIHCYFLDQSRVVSPLPMEKNYHIFYQVTFYGLQSGQTASFICEMTI